MFSVDCHCVVTSNVLNLITRAKFSVSVIPKKQNNKKVEWNLISISILPFYERFKIVGVSIGV